MPQIVDQAEVLNGRGRVIQYGNGNSAGKWVYKERIEGTRTYRSKTIVGAITKEEAIEMATEVAFNLNQNTDLKRNMRDPMDLLLREERLQARIEKLNKEQKEKTKSITVEGAIEDYLRVQSKRVDAGTFSRTSYLHKFYCFKHIGAYLKAKNIIRTNQINHNTFKDYLEFRNETTRILQARECAVIGEFIKSYLVRNGYVAADIWVRGDVLPKVEVRMIDRMANPAINADDWKVIVDYVRDKWVKASLGPNIVKYKEDSAYYSRKVEAKNVYWKHMFWHYILFSKNTGMSPEEVLKLKWKSVEIRDVGRISQTKAEEEIEELEAEGIEVIDECERPPDGWVDSENAIGREERLVAYITTIRSKTKQPREVPCNQGRELRRWLKFLNEFCEKHKIAHKITGDDYVFANPLNDWKPAHQNRIGRTWRNIIKYLLEEGKLKGHKFSDKRYTLYSMRSTFIEDHLIKGTDIFLLARIAGHDVKTLMQSYERMDIRLRAEEITHIDYGKKKTEHRKVNLLEE